jgi:hypothetical protein
MSHNTYVPDVDLVFHRVPRVRRDDLDEIDFADMEPLDDLEEPVGVEPHAAVLMVPVAPYDLIGVQGGCQAVAMEPGPEEITFARYTIGTLADLEAEDFPTDEYTAHDEPAVAAAFSS